MIKLKWNGTDCWAAEHGDYCTWIEPLAKEGEGRFVWSVDLLDPDGGSQPLNLLADIEPSLKAAMLAVEEAITHLEKAGGRAPVLIPARWHLRSKCVKDHRHFRDPDRDPASGARGAIE